MAGTITKYGGKCSYHKCKKAIAGDADKPTMKEFVSKYCLHFKWVNDEHDIELVTELGKLGRMLDKATLTKQGLHVNCISKNVKKMDEGEEVYAQLPIFQVGADSSNQKLSWKTCRCIPWDGHHRGCGNVDICVFFHAGYDYWDKHTGRVYASQQAMAYSLANERIDEDTWKSIKASIPKTVSHSAARHLNMQTPGLQ